MLPDLKLTQSEQRTLRHVLAKRERFADYWPWVRCVYLLMGLFLVAVGVYVLYEWYQSATVPGDESQWLFCLYPYG